MIEKLNILIEADQIINERAEEKTRTYGPFEEGMDRAALILSGMIGYEVDAELMYKAMIALKLSRESYCHKQDNLLDAVAYMGSWNNYINNNK